jgi:hypothetical protein
LRFVATTIVSTAFNYLYYYVVVFIVKKENHELNEPKEASFMIKQMIFRFVNYNLIIFIALYDELKGKAKEGEEIYPTEEKYAKMWSMIFTIVMTATTTGLLI